jgi:hypothetical protein
MTPPESPPPDRYNTAVLGGVVFVLFNVALFGSEVLGGGATAAAIRQLLFFGNLVIPIVALIKGKSRFAAGWAMTIGILLVAVLGICLIGSWSA